MSAMLRTTLIALVCLAGCASNVVAPGVIATSVDPATGEAAVELRDVESGAIALDAIGYADHDGAYVVLRRMGPEAIWQGVTQVELVSGGEAIVVDVGQRDIDAESFPPFGIQQFESLGFTLDDAQLAWLERAPDLELRLDADVNRVAKKVLASLRDFAARVLDHHEGKEGLFPLTPPSEL